MNVEFNGNPRLGKLLSIGDVLIMYSVPSMCSVRLQRPNHMSTDIDLQFSYAQNRPLEREESHEKRTQSVVSFHSLQK